MRKLEVFLDTNEYKRCGHNFNSTPMRKILELAKKEIIHLLTTNVVVGEVSKHIKDDVQTFTDAQKKLAHNAGVIQNLPEFTQMVRKLDIEDICVKAQKAFDVFLSCTKCEILSSNGIDNDALLNDYFHKKLPFEDNTKKGDEFKDAFIIYTLQKYSDEIGRAINVVSSDDGFCKTLATDKRFRIFNRSEELFSYITKVIEEIPAENAETIQHYIKQSSVEKEIKLKIEDTIYSVGIWIEDISEEGDIYSIDVGEITLTYLDDIDNDVLPIHIEASVTLVIDYTCIDENNSYWDREENEYLFVASADIRLTKKVNLDFCAALKVDVDDDGRVENIVGLNTFEIDDARFGISIDIEYSDNQEILHSSLEDLYEEDIVPGAYTTCPDCSCQINHYNDGGNGFCIKCAPNH